MRRGKTVVWMVIGLAAVTLTLILTIAIIAQVVIDIEEFSAKSDIQKLSFDQNRAEIPLRTMLFMF